MSHKIDALELISYTGEVSNKILGISKVGLKMFADLKSVELNEEMEKVIDNISDPEDKIKVHNLLMTFNELVSDALDFSKEVADFNDWNTQKFSDLLDKYK